MQIPPDLTAALAALRSAALRNERGSFSELRNSERHSVNGLATIIPCSPRLPRQPTPAVVCDVSAGGIMIMISPPPLHVKECFILRVPQSTKPSEWIAALFEVAHFRPVAHDCSAIGARYVRELVPQKVASAPAAKLNLQASGSAFNTTVDAALSDAEKAQIRELDERLRRP